MSSLRKERSKAALFDSVNEERTREDELAWASLGVQARYLDLPEALLRKRFPFEIFRRGDDSTVVAALCTAVGEYARSYPDAEFIFPAGFGNHLDHIACKAAAFRLLDQGGLRKIVLYEDVPYSWSKFIRHQTYKTLLRNVELDRELRALAFRPHGNRLFGYLGGAAQCHFRAAKSCSPPCTCRFSWTAFDHQGCTRSIRERSLHSR